MKPILIGLALGFLLVLASYGLAKLLIAALFVVVVVSMIDWSGQGDGREGCNRHTSCNHRH